MVDRSESPNDTPNLDIFVREEMSESLKCAVLSFVQAWTSSYTTASKKFSIWKLLRDHVDIAAAETLSSGDAYFPSANTFSEWLKLRNLSQISIFFKLAIRSTQNNINLKANLESLLEVAHFVLAKKSKKRIASPSVRGSEQINYRKQVDLRHYPYCELCWRFSRAAERDIENPESTLATLRFCAEHDPSIPGSKYRLDHRFRARFHHELERIRLQKNPEGLDEAGIRTAAYNYSHRRATSLRLEIKNMHESGIKKSEIATHLNISRQAVWKSLRDK